MIREYFELEDDVHVKGRWHLNGLYDGNGTQLDSRHFRSGVRIDLGLSMAVPLWSDGTIVKVETALNVSVRSDGVRLDFTYADFDMPVVTRSISDLLESISSDDVQRVPVNVGDNGDRFDVINVTSTIDCIDAAKSDIDWWEKGNVIRPDLAGTPKFVSKLVVDPSVIRGHHVFRPRGWVMRIIVSDIVKSAFDKARVTGVQFRKVSP